MCESKFNQSVSFVNLFRTCHDSSAFLFIKYRHESRFNLCNTSAATAVFRILTLRFYHIFFLCVLLNKVNIRFVIIHFVTKCLITYWVCQLGRLDG
jgi:hypothetical protein